MVNIVEIVEEEAPPPPPPVVLAGPPPPKTPKTKEVHDATVETAAGDGASDGAKEEEEEFVDALDDVDDIDNDKASPFPADASRRDCEEMVKKMEGHNESTCEKDEDEDGWVDCADAAYEGHSENGEACASANQASDSGGSDTETAADVGPVASDEVANVTGDSAPTNDRKMPVLSAEEKAANELQCEEFKAEGNEFYKKKMFAEASESYTKAIDLANPAGMKSGDQRDGGSKVAVPRDQHGADGSVAHDVASGNASGGGQTESERAERTEAQEKDECTEFAIQDREKLAVYYANRAACSLKMSRLDSAIEDCSWALQIKPGYVKALMRRCAAREQKGEDDLYGALEDAKAALESVGANGGPGVRDAADAVRRLEPAVHERQERQKEEMMGKLKDLGNMFLGNFGLSVDNFKMQQDPETGGYSVKFEK